MIDLANVDEIDRLLAQHDESYSKIEVQDKFSKIPDGKYTAKVNKVEFKVSQPKEGNSEGELYLKWELVLTNQAFINRKVWRNNMIKSDVNKEWLAKDLAACGMTLKPFSTLRQRLPELLDLELNITIKNKDEKNMNVFIDGVIERSYSNNTIEDPGIPF